MVVERTREEILVRIPANVDVSELQGMLDYLHYKEMTAKSMAKQSDVNALSKEVNQSMVAKIKKERAL